MATMNLMRRPKKKRKMSRPKKPTLGQMNKRLTETRAQRLAAAEQNCVKITG